MPRLPVALFLPQPLLEQPQRVVPERVDLHGFAAPRRHHPIIHLGIHPRELVALLALPQQTVLGVHPDAEASAAQMVVYDIHKLGQQQPQGGPIRGVVHVAVDRVKIPQRGVGRMIEPLLAAFGKQVGNQAVADIMRERAEDPPGFIGAAGGQREAFQADHGVAAPVGEPVVARDDAADLVALRPGARRVLDAAGRRDEEMIGRERQFGAGAFPRLGRRGRQQQAAAVELRAIGPLRRQCQDRLPGFGRGDQRGRVAFRQVRAEIARAPERALPLIAPALLGRIRNRRGLPPVEGERRRRPGDLKP